MLAPNVSGYAPDCNNLRSIAEENERDHQYNHRHELQKEKEKEKEKEKGDDEKKGSKERKESKANCEGEQERRPQNEQKEHFPSIPSLSSIESSRPPPSVAVNPGESLNSPLPTPEEEKLGVDVWTQNEAQRADQARLNLGTLLTRTHTQRQLPRPPCLLLPTLRPRTLLSEEDNGLELCGLQRDDLSVSCMEGVQYQRQRIQDSEHELQDSKLHYSRRSCNRTSSPSPSRQSNDNQRKRSNLAWGQDSVLGERKTHIRRYSVKETDIEQLKKNCFDFLNRRSKVSADAVRAIPSSASPPRPVTKINDPKQKTTVHSHVESSGQPEGKEEGTGTHLNEGSRTNNSQNQHILPLPFPQIKAPTIIFPAEQCDDSRRHLTKNRKVCFSCFSCRPSVSSQLSRTEEKYIVTHK